MKERIWLLEKLAEQQGKQLDIQIHEAVKKIEELDQHKLYFILDKDLGKETQSFLKQMLAEVKRRLRWTIPNILILNKPFKELSMKELKQLIKTRKKLDEMKGIGKAMQKITNDSLELAKSKKEAMKAIEQLKGQKP